MFVDLEQVSLGGHSCKMVELLVLLGLHIDYPTENISALALRQVIPAFPFILSDFVPYFMCLPLIQQALSPAKEDAKEDATAAEGPPTVGVEGDEDNGEDDGEGDESKTPNTTPRGSVVGGSQPGQELDTDQYVVAAGEWMVHLFQKARGDDDVGGRLLLAPLPHWRESPPGATEVAVAMALLSTGEPMSEFQSWQERFPFLVGTSLGPVLTRISSHSAIPSVSRSANKLGNKKEEEEADARKTIHPADWNTAIGSTLPHGVLGVPRTRTSASSDFTAKLNHDGRDLFLFVAVTLETAKKSKVKTVCFVIL